jgi:AraC family transcriptional regulator
MNVRENVRVELSTTAAGALELPTLAEHRVKIHAGLPVRGACSQHRFLYTRGDIDIQPAGYSDRWHEYQPNTSLIVHYPQTWLRHVAEDSGIDPTRAQLDSHHQVRDAQIEHIAWALEADQRQQQPHGALFTESLCLALAIHLLGRYGPSGRPPANLARARRGLTPAHLLRLTTFIEEHLDEDLSILRLASVAAISSSHLKMLFKQATGTPIHEYVIQRRIDRAKQLLLRQDRSLSQIALETGFAHQSHLARTMRRVLGVTPGELQKSHRALMR